MKLCWIDISKLGGKKEAVIEEAIHQRIDGIVARELDDLRSLPPTTRKILFVGDGELPHELAPADLVIVDTKKHGATSELEERFEGIDFGRYVVIADAASLSDACEAAKNEEWSVLHFIDPTKIPLEIVIAAAAGSAGNVVTTAQDVVEAKIIFGVLEHGSDGVLMAATNVGDATELREAANESTDELDLVELEVTKTEHIGMGERACIDTCTYFKKDEGILVGSHSKGMVLCVSETHPLPYMPTRPFRVNAGAIMSYTLGAGERTNYLSELQAGSKVLAVDIKGKTRAATVGRVKIESRPLISVDATAPDGTSVNLILQDDWHVRVLGPGGVVHNSTELKAGDKVLGYLPKADRHVGYPISEFCLER